MKYTAKYFRDNLPEWKRKKHPILSRMFYRPLSFFCSDFFSYIGWTANMVSYLSAVVAIIACACFVLGAPIVGAVLITVWLLLDFTDGNIARSVKKERYGDFADSMSSYICVGLMFCCMGFSAYNTGGVIFAPGNPYVILMGALAGSSDSLMRLLYQKFLNSTVAQGVVVNRSEDPEQQGGINGIRMRMDSYVSLGGFLPLAVLLASIFNGLDVVVVLWLAYYGLTLVASALHLVRKTLKANEADAAEGRSEKDNEPKKGHAMKRVITYGTFDLLHNGHINLLRRAKAQGDYLIVAVSTDEFNWNHKHKKCYSDYEKRTDVHEYHVDTFAMGDDLKGKFDFLKDEGVEVVYLPRTPEVSTIQIKHDLNGAGGRPWLNLVAPATPRAALNDASHAISAHGARDGGKVVRLCPAGARGRLDLAA